MTLINCVYIVARLERNITLAMDFLQHQRNDEECSICLDDTFSLANLTLDCGHWYHVKCLRERVRYIKKKNSDAILHCPMCDAVVSSDISDALFNELRNVRYRCTLPLYLSRYPTLPVRVAFQKEGKRRVEFFSDAIRVRDLPPDPNRPGQVFIATDLEVTVSDPDIPYRAWVQNANTGVQLTSIQKIKTTSIDDPENEEDEPAPPPRQPVAMTAVPINPVETGEAAPVRRRRRAQPRDQRVDLVDQRRQRRKQRREALVRAQDYLRRAVRLLENAARELAGDDAQPL